MPARDRPLLREVAIFFKVEEDEREIPLFIINGREYWSAKAVSADTKEALQFMNELGKPGYIEYRPVRDIGIFRRLPSWKKYRKQWRKSRKRKE